ncbi:peptide chain release factor 2 [Hydrogenispora ethanolica]|uniref:Peptide chain release factor 2 n=1 Tax=Hydrogenispora ethanolica TaxID=1082276 RepID=A0A4R1QR94_HYDET|nr:peptide chain release factor 2 [Hydrogenispora ethanolica]
MTNLKNHVEKIETQERQEAELTGLLEMAVAEDEEDLFPEIAGGIEELEKAVAAMELSTMLGGEFDRFNVYLTIHPGAGGTESQDWAEMLLRMYVRWAERRGYKVEFLDLLPGDEAGVKSVTLYISGENAYGYLKGEKGVHRLVRISPFDASGRRHTSFSSVDIVPEIDDTIKVEIRPEDLKVDTYRSSGAGGQHVNKTESAIRITHIPTGIVVACQNERSQFQNRDRAMQMLRAKLYELYREEQEAKMAKIKGEYSEIAWGNQIRSYVFCPYTMVKDHRTEVETANVQAVMDGELDPFIEAYLRSDLNKIQNVI